MFVLSSLFCKPCLHWVYLCSIPSGGLWWRSPTENFIKNINYHFLPDEPFHKTRQGLKWNRLPRQLKKESFMHASCVELGKNPIYRNTIGKEKNYTSPKLLYMTRYLFWNHLPTCHVILLLFDLMNWCNILHLWKKESLSNIQFYWRHHKSNSFSGNSQIFLIPSTSSTFHISCSL